MAFKQEGLKVGSMEAVVDMILAAGFRRENTPQGYDYLVIGDETLHAAYRATMDADIEKLPPHARPQDRDNVRCTHQRNATSQGYAWLDVSTSIYGFTVENRMRANLHGGRAALTPRGQTLEESVRFGIDLVQKSGGKTVLRIPIKGLCSLDHKGIIETETLMSMLGV